MARLSDGVAAKLKTDQPKTRELAKIAGFIRPAFRKPEAESLSLIVHIRDDMPPSAN